MRTHPQSAAMVAAVWDRHGWRCALALAATFPTIHVAYDLGFVRGVLEHLLLRRRPAPASAVSRSR